MLRQGQPGTALPLIEPGLSLARRLRATHLTARLLSTRAYVRYVNGDSADAASDSAEALRLYRLAGDQLQAGATLGNLAYVELAAGDLDAARRHLAEALDIARALNDRHGVTYRAHNLGLIEYQSGSPEAAQVLFAESLDLARRIGLKRHSAYPLIGLAMARCRGADPGWSARLHGAADQALADLGVTIEPLERRLADLDRQRLRDAMGVEAFEADYAAGRSLDQASVADEVLHGMQVAGAAQRADALASEPHAARAGLAVSVLTPRELHVLKLVAQGLSNPEIAQRLVLSEHTVHRHLANILGKLNLSSRAAAAAWGVRNGLV